MSRIKVIYVAMDVDGYKPIMTASTFKDLRKGLDEYYAVDRTEAECLGFFPYYTKYPDSYEGSFKYKWTRIVRDEKFPETDTIRVYCVDYFPLTEEN